MTPREAISLGAERTAARAKFPLVHVGLEVDLDGRILRSRPGATEEYGLRMSDVVGEYASDLFVADDMLTARALLHRAARGVATTPILLRMRRLDGAEVVVRVSAHAADGTISLHIREGDATERNVFYAASGRRQRFDALTGLPNRLLLLERAGAALASGAQTLVLLDVDRFRHLVTALGPRVGDRILVEIGDRLSTAMAESGIIGFSSGEFAVIVPAESTLTAISSLIARIRTAIGAPLVANGEAIVFNACLGVATSSDALPVDELKIDTSFVAGLGSGRARTAVVRAIVGLGHALGIAVVAEGIESSAQAFALRALGCEFGQGFHFGRPAPQPTLVSRAQ